jgi:hypothetical protein
MGGVFKRGFFIAACDESKEIFQRAGLIKVCQFKFYTFVSEKNKKKKKKKKLS